MCRAEATAAASAKAAASAMSTEVVLLSSALMKMVAGEFSWVPITQATLMPSTRYIGGMQWSPLPACTSRVGVVGVVLHAEVACITYRGRASTFPAQHRMPRRDPLAFTVASIAWSMPCSYPIGCLHLASMGWLAWVWLPLPPPS